MHYNISYDISGIIILSVLLLILSRMYVMDSRSNRMFRRFVIVALCSGILDLVTAYTIDYARYVPVWLNTLLNTLYMAAANFSSYCGVAYVNSSTKREKETRVAFGGVVMALYAALLVVNVFTGVVFKFEDGNYIHGPLFYSTYVVTLLLIIQMVILLVFKRSQFTKTQIFLFSSFAISPIVFVLIQVLFPDNLLTFFATAVAALLMLFALETPDFVELEYLRRNLEKEVEERTHELSQANDEIARKNHQMNRDMQLAAHLQQALYPRTPNYLGWDIAVQFSPLSGISGDLYDFYVLEGKLRGFGLFDVSGHGISSGLVTVLAKNAIFHEFRTTLPLDLSEAMQRINRAIIRIKGSIENYLTGVLCRIDRDDSSKIELSNAGSPYPVLKRAYGALFVTPDSTKPQYGMLGIEGMDVCFQTISITLNVGDSLVLYTDGLTEAENSAGEQYGRERLLRVVENTKGNAATILSAINADMRDFVGSNELDDDISVVVFQRITEEADFFEELETVEVE